MQVPPIPMLSGMMGSGLAPKITPFSQRLPPGRLGPKSANRPPQMIGPIMKCAIQPIGPDMLGGIGENAPRVRARICEGSDFSASNSNQKRNATE